MINVKFLLSPSQESPDVVEGLLKKTGGSLTGSDWP